MRSLEIGLHWLRLKNADELTDADIEEKVRVATDERLFVIAEALRRNWTIERIAELSNIDPWFLYKLANIVRMERELAGRAAEIKALTSGRIASEPGALDLLKRAKSMRFPDKIISQLTGANESQLRGLEKLKMLPI